MGAMTAWRAGAAIAKAAEVIDRLLESLPFGMLRGPLREHRLGSGYVEGRPMMPSARGGVRIIAKKDETTRLRRRFTPIEWRGKIFAVAGEARGIASG